MTQPDDDSVPSGPGMIITAPVLDPGINLLCARDNEYDPHITLGLTKEPWYDSRLNYGVPSCCAYYTNLLQRLRLPQLVGKATGAGIFVPTDNSDSKYVCYIAPSVPSLDILRQFVVPTSWSKGSDFGYTPHITASYQKSLTDAVEAARFLIAVFTLTPVSVTIDRIVISDFTPGGDKSKRLGHNHEIKLQGAR